MLPLLLGLSLFISLMMSGAFRWLCSCRRRTFCSLSRGSVICGTTAAPCARSLPKNPAADPSTERGRGQATLDRDMKSPDCTGLFISVLHGRLLLCNTVDGTALNDEAAGIQTDDLAPGEGFSQNTQSAVVLLFL